MRTIKNISPVGALSIPSLGLQIEHGKTVELKNDVADALLELTENFADVTKPPLSDAEKKAKADASAKKRAATAAAKKQAAAPTAGSNDSTEEI